MKTATGTFQVNLVPLELAHGAGDGMLGRRSIDKSFKGGLEGTSEGEMLSALTATKGSAGYVAIERVTGSLDGRSGTFILQHSSTMKRGEPRQSVTVVPDSGTGELAGLEGTMTISVGAGGHSYLFEYRFDND